MDFFLKPLKFFFNHDHYVIPNVVYDFQIKIKQFVQKWQFHMLKPLSLYTFMWLDT